MFFLVGFWLRFCVLDNLGVYIFVGVCVFWVGFW